MFTRNYLLLISLCSLLLAIASYADTNEVKGLSEVDPTDVVGDVQFETSCAEDTQGAFNGAVATLHSFEFDEARGMFEAIASEDPDCAMTAWGVAMTYYHPLWAPPTEKELKLGTEAVAKARNLEATEREKLYIEAIKEFFDNAENAAHRERAIRYEKAMANVHLQNPDDKEAEIFYALALLSNADPTDKTYVVQRRTGGMLEPLFVDMPNHPGLAHYIIHSYDYPPLANRAVEAAHRYLDIATSMPHALHMSGHIFTQLGMWEDSIDANTRAVEAARERGRRFGIAQGQMNEMHALDYLVYAYLQRGEDDKAGAIVDDINSRADLNWRNGVITFNAGAAPVRYAMERRDWQAAASLTPLEAAEKVGGNYEVRNAVALRYWARVVGAARIGKIEQAELDLVELADLAKEMASADSFWARNTTEVLRLQATAWLALAKGESDLALELMRNAAELEGQTDKSGLSPGRVLPAHEQLGDMLAELGHPQEALMEYEASMRQAPHRFNTYLGAARAAKGAGKPELARDYYGKLLKLASEEGTRTELAEARNAT
jgi:tetratricopeptide (TPR) repeat protein